MLKIFGKRAKVPTEILRIRAFYPLLGVISYLSISQKSCLSEKSLRNKFTPRPKSKLFHKLNKVEKPGSQSLKKVCLLSEKNM